MYRDRATHVQIVVMEKRSAVQQYLYKSALRNSGHYAAERQQPVSPRLSLDKYTGYCCAASRGSLAPNTSHHTPITFFFLLAMLRFGPCFERAMEMLKRKGLL